MTASAHPPPGSHAATLAAFQGECVALFGEVVQVFGVPRSLGQIYGVLYASPEPLGFSDIVERLEISKGSVSQGLQLLRSLGAIHVAKAKVQRAGSREQDAKSDGGHPAGAGDRSRRVAYEPELRLRRLVSGILQERVAPLAAAGADRLRRLRALAERDARGDDFCLGRARHLERWRLRLRAALPVLTMLLGAAGKE